MSDTSGPSHPSVSVVMSTFRTPPELLATSIESILGQSYDDLELIVVADGALGDEQQAVVDRQAGDGRLRVVRPGRVGRGRALNVGVEASVAPLVAIQDADDVSHPERIERQVSAMARRPSIDLVGAGVRRSTAATVDVSWVLPPAAEDVELLDWRLLVGNPLVHSSVLVRRSSLMAVGGYTADRRYQFDHDLYLRMRAAGMSIGRLPEALVVKRIHPDQAFESGGPTMPRLVSAWRLQMAHARTEPAVRRYPFMAAASVRLAARTLRSWVRRARRAS